MKSFRETFLSAAANNINVYSLMVATSVNSHINLMKEKPNEQQFESICKFLYDSDNGDLSIDFQEILEDIIDGLNDNTIAITDFDTENGITKVWKYVNRV